MQLIMRQGLSTITGKSLPSGVAGKLTVIDFERISSQVQTLADGRMTARAAVAAACFSKHRLVNRLTVSDD